MSDCPFHSPLLKTYFFTRSRLHFSADQVAETLADYLGFLRMIQIPKALAGVCRDPEDGFCGGGPPCVAR